MNQLKNESIKKRLGKRLVRIVIGGVFTAAIVAIFFSAVTADKLWDVVTGVEISSVIYAFIAYIGVTALRAWRYIVAGADVPFKVAFQIAALHSALLRLMPFRSGEFAYGVLMKRAGGAGFVAGMASIFLLRILDLAVVLPLAAVVIAVKLSGHVSAVGIAAIALSGALLSALFFMIKPILSNVRQRFANLSGGIGGKLLRIIDALIGAYDLPIKQRLLLTLITAFMWAALIVWCHFVFLAIGASSIIEESTVASVFGVVGSTLPLSLLGSFGPMEGGFALGFSMIGQEQGIALANALGASGLTLLCSLALALICWIGFVLDDKERHGVDITTLRRMLGGLVFSVFGALLLLVKIPYGFETNDQYQYLLLPYRNIYKEFLVGDWFTWQTSHYHVTFSWLIQGLHALFGPEMFPVAVFALHFVVLMGIACSILFVARALDFHWGVAVVPLLVTAFVGRMGIAETVVNHGVLLPSDIALPLFLAGLGCWILKQPIRTGLFLGMAGFIHANFAVLGPLVIAIPQIRELVRAREIKSTLKMAAVFAIVASPTLVTTVSAFLATDSAPEALRILFNVRSPHHYNPALARSTELYLTITLMLLGLPAWLNRSAGESRYLSILLPLAGTQVVAILATVTQQPLLVRLFLWRLSIPLILLSALGVGQSVALAVKRRTLFDLLHAAGSVAVIAAFAAGGTIQLFPKVVLTGVGWTVPATAMLTALVILNRLKPRLLQGWKGGFAAIPLIFMMTVSLPTPILKPKERIGWQKARKSWRVFYDIDKERIRGKKRTKKIYRWIADNTPRGATFLIPPGNDDFRFATQRGVFVDWKCCPMKGEEIREWQRRMLAVMGTGSFPAKGYRLYSAANRRFLSRSLESVAELARREGVSYILFKNGRNAEKAGLKQLRSREGWTVYEVLSKR